MSPKKKDFNRNSIEQDHIVLRYFVLFIFFSLHKQTVFFYKHFVTSMRKKSYDE